MSAVTIVGSGFIGRAWAISFARAGHEVRLWDQSPEATRGAHAYISGVLADLAAKTEGQAPWESTGRLVARFHGEAIARATARHMEYPYPESDQRRV